MSSKTSVFIVYCNMCENLASDVFLCSLANYTQLVLLKDERNSKFFNAQQEENFHTRDKHILYTLAEYNTWC